MVDLKFEDVYFNYSDDARILHGINLELSDPGLVCIIGPNGVGKSTLVKCINQLLKPTEGSVSVDGRSVGEYSLKELATKVAYVPAFSSDDFSMSVLDTVLMGRHPYRTRKSTKEDLHAVYEVMKELNITHLALRNYDELSAGQHQKVALARGLAQDTDILILDEPTANLDIRHQVQVTELMKELSHEKGITVIMISHDLNVSCRFADKVVVMSTPGIIYKVGAPEDVITEDLIRYVYGMNCRVIDDGGRPHVILQDPIPDEELQKMHLKKNDMIDH